MGRRTTWEICDITGVISILNVLLSDLCSASSGSAILIAGLDLGFCFSDSALLEKAETWVFMPVGLWYEPEHET